MSLIANLFEDCGGILLVAVIFIFCILYTIIKGMILFIPKKIAEHRLSKYGGFKKVFKELLELIEREYPDDNHSYSSLRASIGKINVSFLFNTITIRWCKKKWRYNVDNIVCPLSGSTQSKRKTQNIVWKEVLSDIMLSQSLLLARGAEDGNEKRKLIIDRLFAYEYENLLYEVFQDGIYYTDQYGYRYDGYAFGKCTQDVILERIKIAKSVDQSEAENILHILEDKQFVWCWNGTYKLSDFFTHYWNIITIEDKNINKWSREHNIPKRSFDDAKKYAESRAEIQCGNPVVAQDAYEIVEEKKEAHGPLYTIYRAGPEMLTYSYPVDTNPYKEIYEEDGIIGPSKYIQFPEALDALRNNENDWFLIEDGRKPIRDLVVKDLLYLAKQHNMPEAYSLIH